MLDMNRLSYCSIAVLAIAATIGVAGCARQPAATLSTTTTAALTTPPPGSSAGDPYDPAKMDFNPGPATLSSERHTGMLSETTILA